MAENLGKLVEFWTQVYDIFPESVELYNNSPSNYDHVCRGILCAMTTANTAMPKFKEKNQEKIIKQFTNSIDRLNTYFQFLKTKETFRIMELSGKPGYIPELWGHNPEIYLKKCKELLDYE